MNKQKIGVLDSGVGGLTVVKELEALLPHESIVYFGDNANCPYGNRTADNIVELTKNMIDFLVKQDVKVIAVACNTISSLIDRYKNDYDVPIFSIVKPAADYTANKKLKKIGVVATEFTIKTGCYTKLIHENDSTIDVTSASSKNLAMIIDKGSFNMDEVEAEIRAAMKPIMDDSAIKDVILGCTHYPIVRDAFEKVTPNINYINPAYEQAMVVKKYIEENGVATTEGEGDFKVYTSGEEKPYLNIISTLKIQRKPTITIIKDAAIGLICAAAHD